MGRASKRKGYRGEVEWAELVGGERLGVTAAGRGETDVLTPIPALGEMWRTEVKRRKDGFRELYGWLEKPGRDMIAIRADRKQWLVVLPLERFIELVGLEGDKEEDATG